MGWYLAPSLIALRAETNKRWPNRDHRSDGSIGDASHSARISDHNPDWDDGGVVRATDTDIDGIDVGLFLRSTIGDQRVQYVIHNRRIYSRTWGFTSRVYIGSNPHTAHIHVSLRHTDAAEKDVSAWFSNVPPVTLPAVDLSNMRRAFRTLDTDTVRPGVKRVQRALNARLDAVTPIDGRAGYHTRALYRAWQRSLGYKGTNANGVPGLTSLTKLGAGRFRVIP